MQRQGATKSRDFLQVRDGSTQMATMLWSNEVSARPPDVTSSGNRMLVEFESPVTTGPDLISEPEGFVAEFSARGQECKLLIVGVVLGIWRGGMDSSFMDCPDSDLW